MASNSNSNWEKIQLGVKDTERLIGQKDYNSAMVKARQTLEFMVKQLGERACIVDGSDLKDMIDTFETIRYGGAVFVLALGVLAVFLITNTIKMTIYTRQTEISIMRNV